MTRNWQSSQEPLVCFSTPPLLAFACFHQWVLGAYRCRWAANPETILWAFFFIIPVKLVCLFFSSPCSHNASLKCSAGIWVIPLLLAVVVLESAVSSAIRGCSSCLLPWPPDSQSFSPDVKERVSGQLYPSHSCIQHPHQSWLISWWLCTNTV